MVNSSQKTRVSPEELQEIFERCAERASQYDREDSFFYEDFRELKTAGYFLLPVPEELGGWGMSLNEVMKFQRKLAYFAAPTALAVNMHLHWLGLVADLWRSGDRSLGWILREAAAGKVFTAGHAESRNELPALYSTVIAEKVEGGYCFTGTKSLVRLSPVWSYFGFHAQDNSDPNRSKTIHAFMPRDSDGFEIRKTWDQVLGMRATRSEDTVLNRVFIPEQYIVRELDAGFGGMDRFSLGIFAWALLGVSNVYLGQAQRVFDLVVEKLRNESSVSTGRKAMVFHPSIQHDIGEMALKLEAVKPQLDAVADAWTAGIDYGPDWLVKLVAAKCNATEQCWEIVDRALDIAGGAGVFPSVGLEQLFRDARLGRIQFPDRYRSREILGKSMLGMDLDEEPCWD